MSDDDVLDPTSSHLVVVENPPGFEKLVADWQEGGHTWHIPAGERNYKGVPGDEHFGAERTEEWRAEFAAYMRDEAHQADLEEASVPPVISIKLPVTGGYADDDNPRPGRHHRRHDSGAIHVTRKAKDLIESTGPQAVVTGTGPQRAVTEPLRMREDVQTIVVGDNAPAHDADPGA